ncbi:MAG: TolC family protein [Aquificaceae bacterium]|nr:TolC family protein [Aquificaceae bacterium]
MKFLLIFLIALRAVYGITLEKALELGKLRATEVRLSELEIKRLEQEIRKVRASVLPQVRSQVGFTYLSEDSQSIREFSISLEQPIFNLSALEALKVARGQKKLEELILQDITKEVERQVRVLFFSALLRKEYVSLAVDNLKFWEENLRFVEGKFSAGVLPKVELLRAKAELSKANAELERAKNEYQNALRNLGLLLKTQIDDISGEFELKKIELGDIEKELIQNNSTLKVESKRIEIAKSAVEFQKSRYYPTVSAFASYLNSSARIKQNDGFSFQLRLNAEIFDGYAKDASVAQANIEVLKQTEKFEDLKLELLTKLRNSVGNLRAISARIDAIEQSNQSAKEALRLSTERYRFGIASQLEVLEARRNLNQIQAELLNALYEYQLSLSDVIRLIR